jgi:hypothetical protein
LLSYIASVAAYQANSTQTQASLNALNVGQALMVQVVLVYLSSFCDFAILFVFINIRLTLCCGAFFA